MTSWIVYIKYHDDVKYRVHSVFDTKDKAMQEIKDCKTSGTHNKDDCYKILQRKVTESWFL